MDMRWLDCCWIVYHRMPAYMCAFGRGLESSPGTLPLSESILRLQRRAPSPAEILQSLVHCSVQRCSMKPQAAEQMMSAKLNDFQGRISRCAARCDDQVKDSMGSQPSEQDAHRAQVRQLALVLLLVFNCGTLHVFLITMIPSLMTFAPMLPRMGRHVPGSFCYHAVSARPG
jgi:hypothetical protein